MLSVRVKALGWLPLLCHSPHPTPSHTPILLADTKQSMMRSTCRMENRLTGSKTCVCVS